MENTDMTKEQYNDFLDKLATKNIITRIVTSYGGVVTADWKTGELSIDLDEDKIENCSEEITEELEKHKKQQQKVAELSKKCGGCSECETCSNCH